MSLIECEIDARNLYDEFGGVVSNSCILSMVLVATVFVVLISLGAATVNPDLFAGMDADIERNKYKWDGL